jgi:hypothetical protein
MGWSHFVQEICNAVTVRYVELWLAILKTSNNPFWFFKNSKKWSKNPTLNAWFFHAFFEQTRQSFNFFLKLRTCTYFKSFNKNPESGLFECENFQKLRLRCYNKIQEAPNIWFRGQTRCGLSLLNIETKVCMLLAGVTQHVRFHPFRAFCVGPCSGKAQYLGVYPRGTRLSPPTYSIMQEVSLPQIRFVGARDVWPPASCPDYLVNSMVRFVWGPCCMS